jgi:PAS domain-containing protein
VFPSKGGVEMTDSQTLEQFANQRLLTLTRYARERVETSPLHTLLQKPQELKGERSEPDATPQS